MDTVHQKSALANKGCLSNRLFLNSLEEIGPLPKSHFDFEAKVLSFALSLVLHQKRLIAVDAIKFESLFRQWYGPLCRYAFRLLEDKLAAEDIVQEVFIKVWDKREILEIEAEKAYLFRAVYHAALNQIKADKTKQQVSELEGREIPAFGSPEDGLHLEETEKKLALGLEALPGGCREVFKLSRFEELSYKEIAEVLNISIKTVEAQMGKALKVLRQHLLVLSGFILAIINLIFNYL